MLRCSPASIVFINMISVFLLSIVLQNCLITASTNDTFLTLPQTLYTDRENLIFVRTAHPNTRVSVFAHVNQLSELPQDATIYESELVEGGWYEAKIPYHVPFQLSSNGMSIGITLNFTITHCNSVTCDQFEKQYLSESVPVSQTPMHLLGETDKPVYRPGETVRFRFLALTPKLLWPDTKPGKLATKKLITSEDGKPQLLDLTEDETSGQPSKMTYEEISITDASDTRVKQWLKLSPSEAFLLNYTLLPDAPTGLWTISARLSTGSRTVVETLKFTVKVYVLPRFTISVEHPKYMSFESTYVQFSVCARYTNGPPLFGSVRAHLCVCSQYSIESTENQAAMLEDQACAASRWRPERRPCVPVIGSLSPKDGCARFNVSTSILSLSDTLYPMWMQVPVICAHVEELGTGSNVSRCEPSSETLQRTQAKLEITGPGVYKRDLPLVGTVRLTHPDLPNPENVTIRLLAEEMQARCFYRPFAPPPRVNGDQYRHVQLLLTDKNGVASFEIPPITGDRSIWLKATLERSEIVKQESEMSTGVLTTKSSTTVHQRQSPPKPPQDVIGQKVVEIWQSYSRLSMMIWPSSDSVEVRCPGLIQVQLLANTPLESRTLHVQTVVRGKHLYHVIPPSNHLDPCKDRDDQLGHYRCIGSTPDSDEIECLPGWSGDNCLVPTCSQNCSSPGGVCSAPEQCTCFDDWSGSRCNQCMDPNKCDLATVHIEKVSAEDSPPQSESVTMEPATGPQVNPTKPKPRRTLHLRNISFPVDGNWGPEATVVIFFLDQTDSSSDIVPVNLALKNMPMCTNPAMALEATQPKAGLSLSQNKVSPGQEITLTLVPQGLDQPDVKPKSLTDQMCFVRMQDISLDNFEGQKNLIDLKKINDLVVDSNTYCCLSEADSIENAFRAAGLKIMSSKSLEVIRPMPCPYMAFKAVDSPGIPGPGMMARALPIVNDAVELGPTPSPKPRLRDFFPEVWLFDHYEIEWKKSLDKINNDEVPQGHIQKVLIVPDTITSWRANAFCTTGSNGLWIPATAELTTTMPFFVEITLPKQVKRGEILFLPISVFVSRPEEDQGNVQSSMGNDCLAVSVQAELDPADWIAMGNQAYTDCVCPGEKQTFQLGMMARRLGALNVTVEAHARTNTILCSKVDAKWSENSVSKTVSDRIRRAIQVEPEGIRQDVSIGDILCLTEDSSFTVATFPLNLPSTSILIPDSLRIYLMYSDEVLGPALSNPDQLVRLPIGCGEQNMVLVAPNVYVLDYFTATGTDTQSAVQKLVRTARMHIQSGYQRQLNYRRDDGSYSAFGKSDAEGSTWLTAFVLRVFAKAHRVDRTLKIDWGTLFNETVGFLKQRQNVTTGCFYELGRVLHSGMQGTVATGDVDEKPMLLTAYILSAIMETRPDETADYSPEFAPMIKAGFECLYGVYAVDKSETVARLSTYALAQLAYTIVLVNPKTDLASTYQHELIRRQQHTKTQGVTQTINFWLAQEEKNNDRPQIGALDVETTSYALLTLSKMGVSTNELFHTVRWLSSQQKLEGGFFSTQDTVLGLEAIATFAKRLGLANQSRAISPLDVEAVLSPSLYRIQDKVTAEKQHVSNQFALPKDLDPAQIQQVLWNISSANARQGCLAVHTSLIFHVAESPEQQEAVFQMTSFIEQTNGPPVNACTTALLTICIRPNLQNPQTTGMLLLKVAMVSGWKPVATEILQQISENSESARQIEFAHDDTVSVYFDGFDANSDGDSDWAQTMKRCVKISLTQMAYVEEAKPAQIEAMDYYATHKKFSKQYTLDGCRDAWQMKPNILNMKTTSETPTTTTTQKQLYCPKCILNEDDKNRLTENLLEYVCNGWSNLMVIKVYRSMEQTHEVILSSIGPGKHVSSWNTTLTTQNNPACSCASLTGNATLIWISPNSNLNIQPGTPKVSILLDDDQALIIPIDEAWPAINAARTKWISKLNETTPMPSPFESFVPLSGCSSIDVLWRYIQSKLF